mgnify:CR=1 FL=1
MIRGALIAGLVLLAAAAPPAHGAFVPVGAFGGPGRGPGRFGPPRQRRQQRALADPRLAHERGRARAAARRGGDHPLQLLELRLAADRLRHADDPMVGGR